MAYAILKIYKHSSDGTLSNKGKYNQRNLSTSNYDESKTHLNQELRGTGNYLKDVNQRLEQVSQEQKGKGSQLIIQKNTVKAIEHMMTASPEWFTERGSEGIQEFCKASHGFLKNIYGVENIVSFSLHLDQTTPNITAMVTPIVVGKLKGGKEVLRLGAKRFLNGKVKMIALQDSFAEHCKHLGLERGKKGAKAIHTTIKEFYSLINKADEERRFEVKIPKIEKPSGLDLVQLASWTENQNKRISDEIQGLLNDFQAKLNEKSFKTVKEVLREKNYTKDIKTQGKLKEEIGRMKKGLENLKGENITLARDLKEMKGRRENSHEVVRGLLENRYSEEDIREIAKQVNARISTPGSSEM